ncbi:hypothetical protein [Streptacidiphilus albus]|uniref:hypothetical protein n=1 Tax=Streptacidiphilus albus TaxID=105425 RepID=UPI00054B5048|nr:hypothetical protein [Streptacidiphilus albus]
MSPAPPVQATAALTTSAGSAVHPQARRWLLLWRYTQKVRQCSPAGCTLTLDPDNSFLQLQVTEPGDAEQAADELHELVQTYGLPFARQHASTDTLLTTLRAGGNVPNPDRSRFLIPALHFLRGDTNETRSDLAQGLAHYGQNTSMAVVAEYHRFANALTTRLPT